MTALCERKGRKESMYLTYENLTIRNAQEKDSQLLADWWNDGKIMAHAGFPKGLGTTAEEVRQKLLSDSDGDGRRLIMEHGGDTIGEMSYRNIGNRTAEIGIKICDFSSQEKGYGKILLSLLIRELFRCGFGKIVLDTNLNNTRAQHVYEELGFKRLRIRRDCWRD